MIDSYEKLKKLIKKGKIEIDLVLSPSRSYSTAICQTLVTIADYDKYFHESLGISSTRELLADNNRSTGRPAVFYDTYDHIIEEYDKQESLLPFNIFSLGRKKGAPVKFLLKEMVVAANNKQINGSEYSDELQELKGLATNIVLLTRHPLERIKSHRALNNPKYDYLKLIEKENIAVSEIKKEAGIIFIDTSETSKLHTQPEAYFDEIVGQLNRKRLQDKSISEFDSECIIYSLLNRDNWAAESLKKYSGFSPKILENYAPITGIYNEETATVMEDYHNNVLEV